jgi:hypothetical protein
MIEDDRDIQNLNEEVPLCPWCSTGCLLSHEIYEARPCKFLYVGDDEEKDCRPY